MKASEGGVVCIADAETARALRIAGIDPVEAGSEDVPGRLEGALHDNKCAVVLVTRSLASGNRDLIRQMNLTGEGPVILEIPGKMDGDGWDESDMRYVAGALGIGL